MKILLVSSGVLLVPPTGYGGLEQIVADLAIELDKMGHKVAVVCPEGSIIGLMGNIDAWVVGPPDLNAHAWEENAFKQTQHLYKDWDIIHTHDWRKFAYLSNHPNVLGTLHGMCPYGSAPRPKSNLVCLSKSHAEETESILGVECRYVYNGIDLDKYKPANPRKERKDYYVFIGRINKSKAPHAFIQLLKEANAKGKIIGDDILVEDPAYAQRVKESCNGEQIVYMGGQSREFCIEEMQKAKALVAPLLRPWSEPFGLFAIEANACGCPVIATANGALPELMIHGKTGMLYRYGKDMALDLLPGMNEEECRRNAERFSRRKMAEGYLKLYEEVLGGGSW